MRELPILFNGPMVRAVLEGRKTQTRRLVQGWALDWLAPGMFTPEYVALPSNGASPFGYAGDLLWVRETWADTNGESGPMVSYRAGGDRFLIDDSYPIDYSRYPGGVFSMWCGDLRRGAPGHRWRPSIHMSRWASRITLEVTGVRVERLQDISEADAAAEGVEPLDNRANEDRDASDFDRQFCGNCGGLRIYASLGANLGVSFDTDCRECDSHAKRFHWLWEGINGSESWGANPWVWVVEFKRVAS